MNRALRKSETVNVYTDQAAREAGTVLRTVSLVPYGIAGFESYQVDGQLMPSYLDRVHPTADACVILSDVPPPRRKTVPIATEGDTP